MVKARLSAIKPDARMGGIRLCDGSVILEGWRFLRRAKVQGASQHILLFRVGGATQAIAWVEPRGKEIPIPACPHGPRCAALPEAATVVSGDIYTFDAVRPRGEVVILRYPPASW